MFSTVYDCIVHQDDATSALFVNGWSSKEGDFIWTDGKVAQVTISVSQPGPYICELSAGACRHPDLHPQQRVIMQANGVEIGRAVITNFVTVAFFIASGIVFDRLLITLNLPDAKRPCDIGDFVDNRLLGICLYRLRLMHMDNVPSLQSMKLNYDDVFANFESIGDNCEFGFVQRDAGLEPLGLLRFSGHKLGMLLKSLDDRFSMLQNPSALQVASIAGEWDIIVPAYGMRYHTRISSSLSDPETIHQQQVKRTGFLRERILSDIEAGEKIFVFKRNIKLQDAEALALLAALNRIGNATLLVVRPSDIFHKQGIVEQIIPGLLCGYIDQFGDYPSARPIYADQWRTICERTLQLVSC